VSLATESPPSRPRRSKAQETRRERVIDAAYAMLMTTPYERVQMREISEESGVALATVYRYFASKEVLFVHVLVRWVNSFESRVHNRPLRGQTNEARLADVFTRGIRAFQRMPQFFAAFQVVERSNDPQARQVLRELAAGINSTYATALTGIEPDTVRDVVLICDSVMTELLKSWTLGHCEIEEVYRSMERTVRLLVKGAESELPHHPDELPRGSSRK
jgi:AcrR family transcriptional regulator